MADAKTKAVMELVEVLPKLGMKPEFIEAFKKAATTGSAEQAKNFVEVLLPVMQQNQRVADLYGYERLNMLAKDIEMRVKLVQTYL